MQIILPKDEDQREWLKSTKDVLDVIHKLDSVTGNKSTEQVYDIMSRTRNFFGIGDNIISVGNVTMPGLFKPEIAIYVFDKETDGKVHEDFVAHFGEQEEEKGDENRLYESEVIVAVEDRDVAFLTSIVALLSKTLEEDPDNYPKLYKRAMDVVREAYEIGDKMIWLQGVEASVAVAGEEGISIPCFKIHVFDTPVTGKHYDVLYDQENGAHYIVVE